jgi:hypothetical protein
MIASMTIITTFITPYMVKVGWKIADAINIPDSNHNKNNKKASLWFRVSSLFRRKRSS